MKMTKWTWEQPNPDYAGLSGDISKLFKNESIKTPGILRKDPPGPAATVLAREVIQNSWDAALDLHDELSTSPPPFQIDFRFCQITGDKKQKLVKNLGLSELKAHLESVDRKQLGLRKKDCLDHLDDDSPLRFLVIDEEASGGMYGPWDQAHSKMFLALVSVGYTKKPVGQGGSFGYGKAGLIRGSATRTVIAYTCFKERENDLGVTHRLLGMTYWGQHEIDSDHYTGLARYGKRQRTRYGLTVAHPYENKEANQIATSLGMRKRDPSNIEDQGTTLILLEPTIDPPELCTAIERYWWPALEDDNIDFHVSITTYNGELIYPKPRKNPVLQSFVEAYDVATTPQDNSNKEERRICLRPLDRYKQPGFLGMKADLDGWSYPEQTDTASTIDHQSLIALIRRPRMVVEYYIVGKSAPYIRGVFVADNSINKLLSRAEPKGHDSWQTRADESDLESGDRKIISMLLDRIKDNASRYRGLLKPPERPPDQIRLTHFENLVNRIIAGKSRGLALRPKPVTRDLTINLNYKRNPTKDGQIELEGNAKISFSNHFDNTEATISVQVRYKYIEDETAKGDAELIVEPPPEFAEVTDSSGEYIGVLKRGQNAKFDFVSEPYDQFWSGKLLVEADIIEE